jgi:hypothetical protein
MAREAWTDERLDDLNLRVGRLEDRVDAGFEGMRREFVAVRREMAEQFAAQNRMMIQLFGGMIVSMILGFGGMIFALATQT